MKQIQTKKTKLYNKTLVVGHPLAECDSVMKLLYASGMSPAKSLKKELIDASEISTNLKKAHQQDGLSIQQLEVNPIWNGLALDLLMSNINEEWWGWADCKAVSLLNYWKSVDSKMTFILVYDTPENFIKKSLNTVEPLESLSQETLQNAMNEWYNYNQELLRFYYRNPECSLLVNTEQVKLDNINYIKKVAMRMSIKEEKFDKSTLVTLQQSFENEDNRDDKPLSYLTGELLTQFQDEMNLFEEIQSVANLPKDISAQKPSTPFEALSSVMKKEKENELLLSQLMQTQESLEEIHTEKEQLTSKTKKLQDTYEKLESTKKETTQENELLLSQLMQTQESLEEIYLEKQANTEKQKQKFNSELQKQVSEKEELKESFKVENEHMYHVGAQDATMHLSYRLGQAMIKCRRTPFGLFKLPFELRKASREFKEWKKNEEKL